MLKMQLGDHLSQIAVGLHPWEGCALRPIVYCSPIYPGADGGAAATGSELR